MTIVKNTIGNHGTKSRTCTWNINWNKNHELEHNYK